MWVYILYSSSLDKYYVGITADVSKRLAQHNQGRSRFTSKGVPWKLVTTLPCSDRATAYQLETTIKKRGIKRYLAALGKVLSE